MKEEDRSNYATSVQAEEIKSHSKQLALEFIYLIPMTHRYLNSHFSPSTSLREKNNNSCPFGSRLVICFLPGYKSGYKQHTHMGDGERALQSRMIWGPNFSGVEAYFPFLFLPANKQICCREVEGKKGNLYLRITNLPAQPTSFSFCFWIAKASFEGLDFSPSLLYIYNA